MNYGNGFFYLSEFGDFRLAQNGCFHPALTEINIYKLFGRYGTRISLFCPVERVAEATAGGAEEAGARGRLPPFFYLKICLSEN